MRITVILFLLFLVSCTSIDQAPRPDDYYGDEKMVDIMTDLYLMDAAMTSNRATFTDLEILPNDYIYKKYNTDSLTFKQNLYYYTDRNDEYKKLMDEVKATLQTMRDSIDVKYEALMKSNSDLKKISNDTIPVRHKLEINKNK